MHALPALLLACIPLLDAPRALPSAGSPVAAIDLDRDGTPDVITAGGGIHVLYGGNGTLSVPVTLAAGAAAAFPADVDGDGLTDIVGAGQHDTFLLRNLGQRRFGAPELLRTDERGAIAAGDFTSDGSPDVVIPRAGRNGILLRNDGRGHFTAEETSEIDIGAAATGDVDGDGKLDLVHARWSERMIIERGDGNGKFTRRIVTFSSPATAALEDLDNDGRADIIAMFEADGDLLVYREALDFSRFARIDAGAPHATASGDFNGDGDLDLAVLSRSGTMPGSAPRVLVFLGDGPGKLVRSQDIMISTPYAQSIVTADFNGDGVLDLVLAGHLIFGRGDGTFDTPPILQWRRHTQLHEAIDMNGDGIDELIGSDASRFLVHGVQKEDGTYHFEWLPANGLPVQGVQYAAGDPNEHGWRTLLVATNDEVAVLSRNPDGVWARVRGIPGFVYGLASADLDGDGRREVIVASDRRLRVLDSSGNERFSTETGGFAYFRIVVADVNRDAKPDLIVMRRGTESPVPHPPIHADGFLSLYLGRGDATFEAETRLHSDDVIGAIRVGDFNGDANPDILVEADLARAMTLRGDGRGGFTRQVGLAAGVMVTGDFNGDAILDVLGWDRTLYQGTRSGFVPRGTYVLTSDPRGYALARRAPNARPALIGVMGEAGEVFLVELECGEPRGRGRTVRR